MTTPVASRDVGRRLPPTLVFIPQSRIRQRYLARYAPVAGEWGANVWQFDGVSMGRSTVAWMDDRQITHGAEGHAESAAHPPTHTGLLVAHDGRFVPEGIARMADVQGCAVDWLTALLRGGLKPMRGMPLVLVAQLPKDHGTFRGFNYKGTPFTPRARA